MTVHALSTPGSTNADMLPSHELAHDTRFEWWHLTAQVADPARGARTIAMNLVRVPVMGVRMLCGWLTEADATGHHVAQTFVGTASQAYRTSPAGYSIALDGADDGQLRLAAVPGCYCLEAPGMELYLREAPRPCDQSEVTLGRATFGSCVRAHLTVAGIVDGGSVTGHAAIEHRWSDVDPAELRVKTLALQLDSGERLLVLELEAHGRTVTQATLIGSRGVAEPLAAADLRQRADTRGTNLGRAQLVAANLALDIEPAVTGLRKGALMRSALPTYWEGRSMVRGQLRGRAVRGTALTERVTFEGLAS